MEKRIARNYKICTLDKHLNCSSCEIADFVDCSRHNPKNMKEYYSVLATLIIPSFANLALSSVILGIWYLVPAYILGWLFYQIFGELVIRCRHCPFWDESSSTLNCRINCNVPKLHWLIPKKYVRYKPEPLNNLEKFAIQALSILIFIIPLIYSTIIILNEIKNPIGFLMLSVLFLVVLQMAGGFVFMRYLLKKLCKNCVHFSCPNNRQSFSVIEKYLAKNQIMAEAWKENLHKYKNRK